AIDKNYLEQRKQLEEYLRLNPNDPERVVEAKAGLEMLKALGTTDVAVVTAPENPVPIRVRKALNLIFTQLTLNGRGPYNFAVDTGAVTTVLSHNMAAQLGINQNTPGAKIDLGIAGVGGFEGIVLKVPNVTFKTAKNTETFPQVVAIDLNLISKMIGTEVAGVVGYDFFSEYKLSLDYYGAEVRLSK